MVYFSCTQSDILFCGIARFSQRNKNKLRTFQSQKWRKKIKNSQPQTNENIINENMFKRIELLLQKKIAVLLICNPITSGKVLQTVRI